MAADSKNRPLPKQRHTAMLRDILDFGPDTEAPTEQNFSDRVKRIVRKLKEISRRIDHLSSNF